jgi:DNA-binding MarR family transcriptional regulator
MLLRSGLLNDIRTKALLRRIVQQGPIDLGNAEYRALRRLGFSRADVTRALNRLLAAGQVEFATAPHGAVWARAARRVK